MEAKYSSIEKGPIAKDLNFNVQIEKLIQQQFQIFVPALVLESSIQDENFEWEYDDLHQLFSYFGEIDILEIHCKIAIVLFRSFFEAYCCKEFLANNNNFISKNLQDKFSIKWYSNDYENIVAFNIQEKIRNISVARIIDNLNNPENYIHPKNLDYNLDENFCTNIKTLHSYYAAWTLTPDARKEFSNILSEVNMNNNTVNQIYFQQSNSNYDRNNSIYDSPTNYRQKSFTNENLSNDFRMEDSMIEKSINGKYTCRFDIQIENDKDFQVSRRIMGAKGCNIKRIIEKCNMNYEGKFSYESVKIRLRGKGSGYKEKFNDQEQVEPLNIIIISKFHEKYKIACTMMQELLINIYEEYKRFCERNHKIPINGLSIKKCESLSTKKENFSQNSPKMEFDI